MFVAGVLWFYPRQASGAFWGAKTADPNNLEVLESEAASLGTEGVRATTVLDGGATTFGAWKKLRIY
jgi:hypothetical protein